MTKYKVRVDTKSDITGIMGVIDKSDGDVFLLNQANEDGTEFRVNAKSLLGFTLALCEWPEKWIKCDPSLYEPLKDFIIN